MTALLILTWLLGALTGSMLFFALTVAPTVFRALPAETAGQFLRAFFPHYYLWGMLLALIGTLLSLLLSGNLICTLIFGIVAILFIYAGQWLMPKINRARERERDHLAHGMGYDVAGRW